jgi:Protein of unknown function (DUF2934)
MTLMGRKTVKGRTTSAPKTAKSTAVLADAATADTSGTAGTGATMAMATKSGVTTASAHPPTPAPSHEEIARRSYEIYLARGGEPGHAEEDWLAAERELSH